MEVHAHTHTARKKFTHYLWEFLMLFLAVFCGFLAENQREHMVEHKREKEYIKTFIADLESDTSQIYTFIPLLRINNLGIDSLISALKAPDLFRHPENVYRYVDYVTTDIQFITADRTMQQVKNSGNMRLIRKQIVSDSLMMYDHFIHFSAIRYTVTNNTREEVLNLMDEIISQQSNDNSLLTKTPLLTNDRRLIDIFCNKLNRLKQRQREYEESLGYLHYFGTRIIGLLQKEYQLN